MILNTRAVALHGINKFAYEIFMARVAYARKTRNCHLS